MNENPTSASRPGAVMTAFWLLIVGAVLLMTGGLLTATVGFDTLRQAAPPAVSDQAVRDSLWLYRGVGTLFALAAIGLAAVAVRARDGDPRFRRATMALGLAVVVLVALAAVFTGAVFILALLSLLPIVVGVMFLNRPVVGDWFAGIDSTGGTDARE